MYTRKNRKDKRGGGIFDFFTRSKKNNTSNTNALQAKRNYNLAHSKSRVANVLRAPGTVSYTNKERIEKQYQQAIEKLKTLEQPAETASALKSIATKLEAALQSQEARTAGAVTITIPVGVAQLAWKAMWIFLAAMAFLFIDIPSMGAMPLSSSLVPNRNFNTTRTAYGAAKRITGVTTNRI